VVERDAEDAAYVISFDMGEGDKIKQFFARYGFVVIRNVLEQQQCERTIDEIWRVVEKSKSFSPRFTSPPKRDDPSTWENQNWPGMISEGIVGVGALFLPAAVENRQNEVLHKAFATLLDTEELIVNQDRYGIFRPVFASENDAAEIQTKGAKPKGRNDWKTVNNLHFDMNPWAYVEGGEEEEDYCQELLDSLDYDRVTDFITENNEVGSMKFHKLNVQGLINLADNKVEDGGFHLVPEFHHYLAEFAQLTPQLKKRVGPHERFIVMPGNQPIYKAALRITARAGSAILWDQRVLHGSAPNSSHRFRYAQFFKMFPAKSMGAQRTASRKDAVLKKLQETGIDVKTLTPLGLKLFGLEPWNQNEF